MATPTTVGNEVCALLETSSSVEATTIINADTLTRDYGWQLSHTGITAASAEDLNPVVITTDANTGVASLGGKAGKMVLTPTSGPMFIPPGVRSITYQSTGGAPLLSLNRTPSFYGKF